MQRSFHPEGAVCYTYILHPPDGVAGGDSLAIRVEVEAGAHALITAPGAAKLYRSDNRLAVIQQSLRMITATLLDELLIVRYLGDGTQQAWQLLRGLWATLRPSLLGLPACPPRIWAT